jgi:lipopolysaccharide cholinephosphotransferase
MIDISKLHNDILTISDFFHKFCEENNIKYFLLGGTALGAARHKGFIPWDDDFDACMDYQNYEKFLKLWKSSYKGKDFYLQTENSNEWPLYFSKLRLNNSRYLEKEDIGRDMHNGVYIDIMCLNRLSRYKIMRWTQFTSAKILSAEALSRRGYKTTSFKKILIIYFSKVIVGLVGKNFLLRHVRSYNFDISSTLFGHFFGRAPYKKSLINISDTGKGSLYEFSGRYYYSFSNLSAYLQNRFGENYLEIPNEETKANYPSHCIEYEPRHKQ